MAIRLETSRPALLLALLLAGAAPAAAEDAKGGEPVSKLGERVFMELAQPSCQLCHRLAAAGAEGAIGPDLDELAPTEERVRLAVQRGVGNMPAFGESLTKEQIEAVARYVAEAVRQ